MFEERGSGNLCLWIYECKPKSGERHYHPIKREIVEALSEENYSQIKKGLKCLPGVLPGKTQTADPYDYVNGKVEIVRIVTDDDRCPMEWRHRLL